MQQGTKVEQRSPTGYRRDFRGARNFERDAVTGDLSRCRIVDADPELKAHPRLRRVLQERCGERARMYHVG
jgi:hypothetical protein